MCMKENKYEIITPVCSQTACIKISRAPFLSEALDLNLSKSQNDETRNFFLM
jgi:hypothetical protein